MLAALEPKPMRLPIFRHFRNGCAYSAIFKDYVRTTCGSLALVNCGRFSIVPRTSQGARPCLKTLCPSTGADCRRVNYFSWLKWFRLF